MVDDEAVEGLKFLLCERDGFVAEGEVGEVAGEDADLVFVLGFEVAERLLAAGDEDEVVAALEQVVRDCEADAAGGAGEDDCFGHAWRICWS